MSETTTTATASSSPTLTASTSEVEEYYRDIAPFYDAELAGRGDLAFWQNIGADVPDAVVLEIGAGSGAVTEALALRARSVIGIDLSDDLLQLGRRRLQHYPHVSLIRADMRRLPFTSDFDLIVAANDPFSHLTDGEERTLVLRGIADHLRPGGQFILDALWMSPSGAAAVRAPGGQERQHEASLRGQPLKIVEHWQRDPQRRRCCQAHYEYRLPGCAPVEATFLARDWTACEMIKRFTKAGLVITDWWGNYDREPWSPVSSHQLIVAAGRLTVP